MLRYHYYMMQYDFAENERCGVEDKTGLPQQLATRKWISYQQ